MHTLSLSPAEAVDVESELLQTNELLLNVLDSMESHTQNNDALDNNNAMVETGRALFSKTVGPGCSKDQLIVIGGRPSSLHHIIAEMSLFEAMFGEESIALVSTRHGLCRALQRYLGRCAAVADPQIFFNYLTDQEWHNISEVILQLKQQNRLNGMAMRSLNIDMLLNAVRSCKQQNPTLGTILVAADQYIQPFATGASTIASSSVGEALKWLALHLNINIVLCVDLSSEIDSRAEHFAYLHDFPQHMMLVDVADTVVLCERPDIYRDASEQPDNRVNLSVYKHQRISTVVMQLNELGVPDITSCCEG